MVTASDQSGPVLPLSGAGVWDAARAATLAASPFWISWADFAPAFAASVWAVWLSFMADPFGDL
jgi:hypothetical protein